MEQASEEKLEGSLKISLNLLHKITKRAADIHCGIDYATWLGNSDQPANLLPTTPFSRLTHLLRAVQAFREYPKVNLFETVADKMRQMLLEEETAVYKILLRLNDIIPKGFTYLPEIRFLLEETPDLFPKGSFSLSLPEAIRRMHEPLFSLWRENIIYRPASERGLNLFARLNQLEELTKERSLTSEEQAALGAPLGTLKDASQGSPMGRMPATLFGKAGLVQRIVAYVLKGAPAHFPRFHHLLTHPDCSIGAALEAVSSFLQGLRTEPLRHTVANRLDEIQTVWKKDIAERIFSSSTHWPTSCGVPSLFNSLERMRRKLMDIEPHVKGNERPLVTGLQTLCTVHADGTVPFNSLVAPLITLAQILALPSFAVDDRGAQIWVEVLGNASDTVPRTLFGILNTITGELSSHVVTQQTLERAQTLIGTSADAPTVPKDPNRTPTFWSLVNGLMAECLRSVYSREALWKHIDTEKSDAPSNEAQTLLLKRLRLMDAEIGRIFKEKTYRGVERLIEALAVEEPRLFAALDAQDGQNDVWWDPNSLLYGPLNRILGAARCSEILTVMKASPLSSCSCQQVKKEHFQDLFESLIKIQKKLHTNLIASTDKTVEDALQTLIKQIGAPFPLLSGPLRTTCERLLFLQTAIPSLAPLFEDGEDLRNRIIGEQGLNVLFRQIEEATRNSSPENLTHTSELLTEVSACLDQLTHQCLATLLSVIVDPYRAQYDGFVFQPKAALRCDLQTLRHALELEETIEHSPAFRRLGGPWESAHDLTIFGRLAALEESLLEQQDTALPVEFLLQQAGRLVRKAREMAQEGWTDQTNGQIGTAEDTFESPSLFGTLNSMLYEILVAPLAANFKIIEEQMLDAMQKTRGRTALTEGERNALSHGLEIGSERLKKLTKVLNTLSVFLRPRTAQQFEVLSRQLFHETQELLRELDLQTLPLNFVENLLDRLGDLDEEPSSSGSIHALINTFTLRLHTLFLPLAKAWTSSAFEMIPFLEERRQALRPGTCHLYYLTDMLRKIQTASAKTIQTLHVILEQPQTPSERVLPPEAARIFNQKTNHHLDALTAGARSISEAMQAMAQNFSYFLTETKLQNDLSDEINDLADGAMQIASETQALVSHLGYVVPAEEPISSLTVWDHSALPSSFAALNGTLEQVAETVMRLAQAREHWGELVSDPSTMGLKLAFQSLELKGSIQPLQTILTSLRKVGKGALLCAECDSEGIIEGVENLSTRIEQISDALTTLSRALEEEARTGLLRRSEKALEGAFETVDGVPLSEIEASWPARAEALETKLNRIRQFLNIDD